jgi:hypothetical protein
MKTPAGYEELSGDFAPVWNPTDIGEFIEGTVTEVKRLKSKKGRKSIDSRLMTLVSDTGAQAVWLSAGLEQILGKVKDIVGRVFMIAYEGTKKIPGQGNPMKVFRVFEKQRSTTAATKTKARK